MGNQLIGGRASKFYSLMRQCHPPKLEGLKRAWEDDLGGEIAEDVWKEVACSWYKTSREVQTRLITYKVIHRSYKTPSKMAKLKLRESNMCWRCGNNIGTLIHMLYECQRTHDLWENIILLLNKILRTNLVQSPALCILGIITEGVDLSTQQTMWCRLALAIGCRIILRHWKTKTVIPFNEWLTEIIKIASYEQLSFKLNNRQEVFSKIWGPFMSMVLNG